MNMRFEYLYRDASNFKKWGDVVFAGGADEILAGRLRKALHDGEWFIASQVRIPEMFLDDYPLVQDDHCWHEFNALVVVDASANDVENRTIDEFVVEVERASTEGWTEFDPRLRRPGENQGLTPI